MSPPDAEARGRARCLALGPAALRAAAALLAGGGLAVVPTETFYALAADPRQPAAVARLRHLKGRDAHKPLPLVASTAAAATAAGPLPAPLAAAAAAHWPGPLTVICAAAPDLAPGVAGADGTMGVRVSGLACTRELAAATGGLLVATSANLAGEPPPATVAALAPALWAGVDLVLDGGTLAGGLPSTIVAQAGTGLRILRAGAVPAAALGGASCDALWGGRLRLWQPARGGGYRFNLDPLLLASQVPAGEHLLDLGAGCGVLGILLLAAGVVAEVTAVERQPELAALLRQNRDANNLGGRLHVVEGDLREVSLPAVDRVAFNPPYFRRGEGRAAGSAGREAGRRELFGDLADFAAAARRSVRPGGWIGAIVPAGRGAELHALLDPEPESAGRGAALHILRGARPDVDTGRGGARGGPLAAPPAAPPAASARHGAASAIPASGVRPVCARAGAPPHLAVVWRGAPALPAAPLVVHLGTDRAFTPTVRAWVDGPAGEAGAGGAG